MAPTLPFTRLDPVEVFAVEDTCAQLVWRGLPAGELGVVIDGGDEQRLGEAGAPGAAELTGLQPERAHTVTITVDGKPVAQRCLRTEPGLEGDELLRVATISDLHLGEDGFGLFKPMRERPEPPELHPLRCARAAVLDAVAWGAEILVVKGDITEAGEPAHWELFDELLAGVPIPVIAIPGNHDTVATSRSVCAAEALQARGLFASEVQARDLPGVRIVAADTTVPGRGRGRVRSRADDLAAALDVPTPVLLFMHHHLETTRLPWFWPLGVRQHEGAPTMARLFEANPDLVISSGHTHRNRIRRHATGVLTEVGSTKDHPGVWAGYVVHSHGVRQVVRRVSDPSCLAWTDRTHAAVGGIWGRWSPGRIHDRVITHEWTRRGAAVPAPSPMARLEG